MIFQTQHTRQKEKALRMIGRMGPKAFLSNQNVCQKGAPDFHSGKDPVLWWGSYSLPILNHPDPSTPNGERLRLDGCRESARGRGH